MVEPPAPDVPEVPEPEVPAEAPVTDDSLPELAPRAGGAAAGCAGFCHRAGDPARERQADRVCPRTCGSACQRMWRLPILIRRSPAAPVPDEEADVVEEQVEETAPGRDDDRAIVPEDLTPSGTNVTASRPAIGASEPASACPCDSCGD